MFKYVLQDAIIQIKILYELKYTYMYNCFSNTDMSKLKQVFTSLRNSHKQENGIHIYLQKNQANITNNTRNCKFSRFYFALYIF